MIPDRSHAANLAQQLGSISMLPFHLKSFVGKTDNKGRSRNA